MNCNTAVLTGWIISAVEPDADLIVELGVLPTGSYQACNSHQGISHITVKRVYTVPIGVIILVGIFYSSISKITRHVQAYQGPAHMPSIHSILPAYAYQSFYTSYKWLLQLARNVPQDNNGNRGAAVDI